jgi:hypothetical protein
MLLSMLPLFGTHQMEQLLLVHKYAGLALTVVALWHLYLAVVAGFWRR